MYKRQSVKYTTRYNINSQCNCKPHISNSSWDNVEAVSYTHLDVYKRQPVVLLEDSSGAFSCNTLETLIIILVGNNGELCLVRSREQRKRLILLSPVLIIYFSTHSLLLNLQLECSNKSAFVRREKERERESAGTENRQNKRLCAVPTRLSSDPVPFSLLILHLARL